VTTSQETLVRLSLCDNFAIYEFGRIEKALEDRRKVQQHMNGAIDTFDADADYELDKAVGPWIGEPDKVQWIDETTGYDCLMVRNHFGAWCGYVGVSFGHPLFGREYGECSRPVQCTGEAWGCEHTGEAMLSVHGGITFTSFCDPEEKVEGICHVPAPGRPEQVWWYGFDCGHAWDLMPGMATLRGMEGGTYKDVTYVVEQVESLALQMKALETVAQM
jgi:hypothetical protein